MEHTGNTTAPHKAALVAQMVKNMPAMQETQVRSVGQEDLLEKGTATHSSVLACRIPWTEEPGGLWAMGSQSQTHIHHMVQEIPAMAKTTTVTQHQVYFLPVEDACGGYLMLKPPA